MAIRRIGEGTAAHPLIALPASPVSQAPAPARPAQWKLTYRAALVTFDLMLCTITLLLLTTTLGYPRSPLISLIGASAFVFLSIFMRGYDTPHAGITARYYGLGLRIGLVWSLVITTGFYFLDFHEPPAYLAGSLLLVTVANQVTRTTARIIITSVRRRGRCLTKTIIIGKYKHATQLAQTLNRGPYSGCKVIGVCTPSKHEIVPQSDSIESHVPILSGCGEAVDTIAETGAELVIISGSHFSQTKLRRLGWELENYNVQLLVAPNLEDVSPVRLNLRNAAGTPLLKVALRPSRHRIVVKGLFDRIAGTAILALAAIPLALLALAVKVTSPGPAFFVQERVGVDGRGFRMYKLRTMRIDAEKIRTELLDDSDGNAVMFKMRQDPRVTPVGKTLRRFSLDELPQLFNVVRGEMSLVGPRPPLPEEVDEYTRDALRRLKVKPGLTGLWQVSGRSDLDWDETVRLDLSYVDNWSLRMDLGILFRTLQAVVGGRGAY